MRTSLWPSLGLAAVVLAVFSPMLGFDFVGFDDGLYVTANLHVTAGLTWSGVVAAFTDVRHYWQPLASISHMLDVEWFGLRGGPHHFWNLVLYAANALLLFLLLRLMTLPVWASAAAAALHALHPLRVETVAWVAQRNELLAGLFGLGAAIAYVRAPEKRLRVWVLFALCLMSKPTWVVLPLLLLVLDWWPLRRSVGWVTRVVEKWPLFLMSSAVSAGTYLALHGDSSHAFVPSSPPGERMLNAVAAYGVYLGKILWPVHLAVLYPYTAAPVWLAALSGLLLAVAFVLAWRCRERYPFVLAGWLWFAVALLPVSGIVRSGFQGVADRFTYVPMMGLCVVVAGALRSGGRVRVGASAIVLAACLVVTTRQVEHWRNTITLFQHTVNVTNENPVAEMYLGNALLDAGRPGDALPHLERAARSPYNVEVHRYNLARGLYALNRHAEAEAAAQANGRHAESQYLVALAARRMGRLDAAETALVRALELGLPAALEAEAANNAGVLAAQRGDLAAAEGRFRRALAARPDYPDAYRNLVRCLAERAGRK